MVNHRLRGAPVHKEMLRTFCWQSVTIEYPVVAMSTQLPLSTEPQSISRPSLSSVAMVMWTVLMKFAATDSIVVKIYRELLKPVTGSSTTIKEPGLPNWVTWTGLSAEMW